MAKRSIPPIVNGRVALRLLEERDLPMTRAWRNQDHVRKWFFTPDPITAEQHRAWFDQYARRDDDFVFIIEELATNRAIGQVALYHIDWNMRRAEFGRLLIGEADANGKGFARAATALLVAHALNELGLREVFLEVFADNVRARAIYARCGFVITARRENIVQMITQSNEGEK
ncbi:MAG: GNAT family N-acetyltransferase [Chloroflexi bacterium]|nr:GNAT family N-acetyltransferase [Chloroflexota bacterium]